MDSHDEQLGPTREILGPSKDTIEDFKSAALRLTTGGYGSVNEGLNNSIEYGNKYLWIHQKGTDIEPGEELYPELIVSLTEKVDSSKSLLKSYILGVDGVIRSAIQYRTGDKLQDTSIDMITFEDTAGEVSDQELREFIDNELSKVPFPQKD